MTIQEVGILHVMSWRGKPKFARLLFSNSNQNFVSFRSYFHHFLLFVCRRLLAKLDKADRALCFTSGMAALAAVTHLVGTGIVCLCLLLSVSPFDAL